MLKPMFVLPRFLVTVLLGAGLLAGAACAPPAGPVNGLDQPPAVLGPGGRTDLAALAPALGDKRVVFVGERHDRFDHHLNQLDLIRALHARDPELAIGLEQFQRPFQPWLDGFIAGSVDEGELLERSEYFQRWGLDYRLYRPILRFARQQRIPLVALNVPREVSRKVARTGLHSLGPRERIWVPEVMEEAGPDYRARLQAIYEAHPQAAGGSFERFLEAQLLWDEAMAERAAEYLRAHPQRRLVVLAGNGHLAYRAGIPRRLTRRLPVSSAVVLQSADTQARDLQGADYLVLGREVPLPARGRLGVLIDREQGGVVARDFVDDSAAQQAGMRKGDRIVAVGALPIRAFSDLRLALQDHRPGDAVTVTVERAAADRRLALSVTLN